MSNIKVTYADMEQAATRLQNGEHEIDQKLTEMRNFINQLVSTGFVTEKASQAFDNSYASYTKSAQKVIAALDDMQKYLHTAANTMRDTDARLASAASSL
jgi:WXG100 family type VII secretion target